MSRLNLAKESCPQRFAVSCSLQKTDELEPIRFNASETVAASISINDFNGLLHQSKIPHVVMAKQSLHLVDKLNDWARSLLRVAT